MGFEATWPLASGPGSVLQRGFRPAGAGFGGSTGEGRSAQQSPATGNLDWRGGNGARLGTLEVAVSTPSAALAGLGVAYCGSLQLASTRARIARR